MISAGTRLIIGTIVGFFSGLGLLGISAQDNHYLTDNIDSVVGGAIALVSLFGFLEHHLHEAKHEREQMGFVEEEEPVTEPASSEPAVAQAEAQPAQ